MSKFTEEMVQAINEKLSGRKKVTYVEATEIADSLEIEIKSLAPKLRSMGIEVGKKAGNAKKFTEQEERRLQAMVAKGAFIEDIAEALQKTVPQIRGKLLHMQLSAPTKNKKPQKTPIYTEEFVGKIKTDLDAGMDIEAVAKKYSVNPRGLKSQLSKLGIIEKTTTAKFWTEEKVQEAIELFNSTTETVDKLAEKMGVSYPHFCKVLKQADIDYSNRKPEKTA